MDAAKRKQNRQTPPGVITQLWRRMRFYYRCFLLHFLLSAAAVTVLFCLRTGFASLCGTRAVTAYMTGSVYDFDSGAARIRNGRDLSERILAAAVYLPMDMPGLFAGDAVTAPFDDGERMTVYDTAPAAPAEPLDGREGVGVTDHTVGETLYRHPGNAPPGSLAVVPCDLSAASGYNGENGGILFSNQTGYAPDAAELLDRTYPIAAPKADAEEPLVLILHTHGTESYAPDGATFVPADFHARTENTEENVVSVGRVLARTLEEQGISVLHCETMFDRDSYPDSYTLAAAYIKETVAQYPSICYVFDVHRDALSSSDGGILRPVTVIDGEVAAQVMTVVGTDDAGASHAGWRDNLTVAVQLQSGLCASYPAFVRPINLRRATFNAQYAPGSLLLEIGSSGNSVEEARAAAYYLGKTLGSLILHKDTDQR